MTKSRELVEASSGRSKAAALHKKLEEISVRRR